ncbi:GlsB/YeaQ/YmgE family stress response membrane protein [Georgenia halophila]|uniref:GlsB/YeaQ/YmgE family stress response membrane protein n=1 Tax=Georgenia halophila TaxID=620889 RepID=A0ABP8KZV4_9MICO
MGEIIGLIVFGAVIGALARLVMKGNQNIGIIWTIVLGALGALVGYWIGGMLGVGQTDGIDWIRWILSIVAAVIFIGIYMGIAGRRTT